jgi:hypothetical protein
MNNKQQYYWTQSYQGWAPLVLDIHVPAQEPEITDFSEAQKILAKIMSK